MEAKRACCVPGCEDVTSKRHRFPKNDSDRFEVWKKNVGHPKFNQLTVQQIYRSYFVCDRHFAKKFIVPGTKRGLRADAIPTIFLSAVSDEMIHSDDNNSENNSNMTQSSQQGGPEPSCSWIEALDREEYMTSVSNRNKKNIMEEAVSSIKGGRINNRNKKMIMEEVVSSTKGGTIRKYYIIIT